MGGTQYRKSKPNLRTHLLRFMERAGVEPWPKLFHNLRSLCTNRVMPRSRACATSVAYSLGTASLRAAA